MSTPVAISIGNFDGVHRGHASLIAAAREAVGADGRIVVLAFDPHPTTRLRAGTVLPSLSIFPQRLRWLLVAGADEVHRVEPTPELLAESPEDFVRRIATAHQPSFVVEGPDFRFGRDRAGCVQTLRALETSFGYSTIVLEPVEAALTNQHRVRVSSSMIRWLVGRGRVRDAAALLGRAVEIETTVVSGDRRGRSLGVPTANLEHGDRLLPADGIYAGRGRRTDGPWLPAAISVGTKPTFGSSPRVCEAHLVGYDGPLDDYGWTIRLEISSWLRDQITYADVDQLRSQLDRDVARAAAIAG